MHILRHARNSERIMIIAKEQDTIEWLSSIIVIMIEQMIAYKWASERSKQDTLGVVNGKL